MSMRGGVTCRMRSEYTGRPLEAARITLIDDVCTTGATLEACAAALRGAGAIDVNALTVAREV